MGENKKSEEIQGCPADSESAGKADICQGCPGRELCSSIGGEDPDQRTIDIRMKVIKHKLLVMSGKGGVGKSSVTSLLSMAFANLNKTVGICDLDICGPNIPHLLNVQGEKVVDSPYGWKPLQSPHSNIKVMSIGSLLQQEDLAVIWRGPRKTALIKRFLKDTFWGKLDFLVFDTPPGTSDEHLSVVKALQNVTPSGAVLVTTPQDISLNTIKKEINFCRKMKIKIIGVVLNMCGYVCPCCKHESDLFVNKGTDELCKKYEIPFLGKLPLDREFTRCCEEGKSIFTSNPDGVITENILKIANDIIQKLC